MTISIEIPKEFEEHFNMDRFKDSLERIRADIRFELEDKAIQLSYITLSGRYEIELIEMLRDAFDVSKVIKEN